MSERFKLIAEGLDVGPLLKKLDALPELWTEHTERQHYPGSAHKDTETIYLRWATDKSIAGGFYCLESEDHEETIRKIGARIFYLMHESLEKILPGVPQDGELPHVGRVILTKLKPGGVITEHVDEGPYADHFDRFHVVLSGVSRFTVGGEHFFPEPGALFWFNHKLPHAVANWCTGDRIHLIIDVVAPEYRKLRGLTFQRERPHELLDEARPLFEAHYKEIAHYQDIALDINEAAYCELEEAGLLRCFTARYNGDLVGYCVFIVRPNLRYSQSLQASQDILYLDKSRRGALYGKRLLDFCHERLRAEGVQVVYQHSKADAQIRDAIGEIGHRTDVGRIFEKLGYELIDLIHGKRLDR